MIRLRSYLAIALLTGLAPAIASAQDAAAPSTQQVEVSPVQLFAVADAARDAGDIELAEQAYRALATNPDLQIRSEARFRLAMMLSRQPDGKTRAAVELRRILDEQPNAGRVRIELARLLAEMGDFAGARRELRQAQAAGLPEDVARLVAFYSDALRSTRRFGASLEVALAPDSNINRGAKSETLPTVLGDFTLDDDARERSGLGLALKQQAYARLELSPQTNLLVRGAASANLYQQNQFNDVSASVQAGPEIRLSASRLSLSGVYVQRWFGGNVYAKSSGMAANLARKLGQQNELRLDGSVIYTDNLQQDAQDGRVYSAGVALERSFSSQTGGALQFGAVRQDLRDPGYASTSGSINALAFRDIGSMTIVVGAGYSHLEADERLALFPKRRIDDQYSVRLSSVFRQLEWRGFSPVVRVQYALNASTVEIYDYERVSSEIGISRAF